YSGNALALSGRCAAAVVEPRSSTRGRVRAAPGACGVFVARAMRAEIAIVAQADAVVGAHRAVARAHAGEAGESRLQEGGVVAEVPARPALAQSRRRRVAHEAHHPVMARGSPSAPRTRTPRAGTRRSR